MSQKREEKEDEREEEEEEQQQTSSTNKSTNPLANDPYDLLKYIEAQRGLHARVMRELRGGQKQSCWSWQMWPTAPWIVKGVERGSWTNQEWSLRDPQNSKEGFEAAKAYLRCPEVMGVNLRRNLLENCGEIANQLEKGNTIRSLCGILDDPKLRSHLRLFEKVSRGGFDDEIHELYSRTMKLCKEKPDP